MVNIPVIICITIFLFASNIYCEQSYDQNSLRNERNIIGDELIFATTICRHGDRNINGPYPTDPYKSEAKFWPEGFGQLTNIGKRQHFMLGGYLRNRYESLLGNGAYTDKKVYIRSTDIDRVLMSAQANMAGLFPPFSDQVWDKQLNWQPVPVHTQPLADDYLLVAEKRCDHYNYMMLQFMNSSSYTNYFTKYKSLITYLEKNSGQKLTRIIDIFLLYNALYIEQLKYKRIPDWAEKVMQPGGDFEYLSLLLFELFVVEPEMRIVKSGYLLKDILDRFTNKTQGTLSPDRTLWMYFAHDNTITNMLTALGVFKLHAPPYASCLFFELYQGHDFPYVQIFYRMSPKAIKLPPINIPGCGPKCPLEKLYQIYADVLPTRSHDDECALRDGEILPPGVISVVP